MQRESGEVDLWQRLPETHCPVFILRGGASGSMLSPEAVERYQGLLPRASVAVLQEAGHVLWQPDLAAFVGTVETWLRTVDPAPLPPSPSITTEHP